VTVKKVPSGEHAIMAIDPGGTTGVFAGYVTLETTLLETMRTIRRTKQREVYGEWREQAEALAVMINRFIYTANVEERLPLENVHVAFEDFILRMPATTDNLTSIWVMAGTVTLANPTCDVTYEQASAAKQKAPNKRFAAWGLDLPPSEHLKDSKRHFILRVDKLLDGK